MFSFISKIPLKKNSYLLPPLPCPVHLFAALFSFFSCYFDQNYLTFASDICSELLNYLCVDGSALVAFLSQQIYLWHLKMRKTISKTLCVDTLLKDSSIQLKNDLNDLFKDQKKSM